MQLAGSYINVLAIAKTYGVQCAELRSLNASGNEVATFAAVEHSWTGL